VWPRRVEKRIFELMLRGARPVIAHPERYRELEKETDALDPLLEAGACTLLDLMSLVGKYGGRARRTAERLLEEGAYDAACSDSHRPEDVVLVGKAIDRLIELVGEDDADALLERTPRALLDGTYEP
jgi:protein-tyrosine phosphatase